MENSNYLEKVLGVTIEFNAAVDQMRINMEGDDNNFYANLDEVIINPKIVNLHNLELKKNSVKVGFKAPIIFNPNSQDFSGSMMAGVKFDGVDRHSLIEKIEEKAKSFGEDWEKAVEIRKREILERNTIKR